jgi:hypothetical protein
MCVVWLLCLSITAASLDNVPDPPAIKQRVVQSQSLDFSEQLQHAAGDSRQSEFDDAGAHRALFALCIRRISDPPSTVGDSPLMRQAADPSPPASAL